MIAPLGKRICVEPVENKLRSPLLEIVEFDKFNVKSSGIEGRDYTKGKVFSVGPGCDPVNGARIGDIIVFTKNGGLPTKQEGKDLLILSEKDVMYIEED